jgi:3-hydroxyacyl-[acyl-carrier-protein] dehydratase
MRFHLIDRIEAYEPGRSVRARKVTSLSEEYWSSNAHGTIMPAPLVLEFLCQAGSWLIMLTTERRKRAALLQVASVAFLADVHPGDVLEATGFVESMSDEMAVLSGSVSVDGHEVLTATDIMCALIDGGDLEDLGDTLRMQQVLTLAAGT